MWLIAPIAVTITAAGGAYASIRLAEQKEKRQRWVVALAVVGIVAAWGGAAFQHAHAGATERQISVLTQAMAPRVFADVDRARLVDALRKEGVHKLTLLVSDGNAEALEFAEILEGVFKDAGWKVNPERKFIALLKPDYGIQVDLSSLGEYERLKPLLDLFLPVTDVHCAYGKTTGIEDLHILVYPRKESVLK